MTSPAPNAQAVTTKRGIWGWVMFDWAAQPFFTVVTTFVFGPYFVARLTDDPIAAQATWSNVATVSSIIIALFSPILGSIADQSGARKPWIAFLPPSRSSASLSFGLPHPVRRSSCQSSA